MFNPSDFLEPLKKIGAHCADPLPNVLRVVDDTREVKNGDLFVLRQGATPLSNDQAQELCKKAIQAGACALITDPKHAIQAPIPNIHLPEPHLKLGAIAEAFYGNPAKQLQMIAVTGSNGKTTTTYLIESIAKQIGLKIGVLGTISYRFPGFEEPALNTTPGTLKLYRLLRAMVDAQCTLVAMEVSSHAIMQGRIDGIAFDVALWNNLGTDHLDFHKTREAYALAKQRLFDHYLVQSFQAGKHPVAIANADDLDVLTHVRAAQPKNWGGKLLTYSIEQKNASIQLQKIQWNNQAWNFQIAQKNQTYTTALPLVGKYNVANAAAAISALHALQIPIDQLASALPHVAQIPGRMETVAAQPNIIVDFAHTPEALENALAAARECVPKNARLLVVFGAGGDRDPSKRPIMGKIAAQCADLCFVTSDNPRTENPLSILQNIMEGIHTTNATVLPDRAQAIQAAIQQANANDVLLIAGKGHENYQILGTQKIHFDDREIARNCLKMQSNP